MRYAELRRGVREALAQEHRYAHVVRTARLAERLAAAHGVDTGRARTAGMLHDLARLWPAERLVAECEARGVPIDAYARAYPLVLHAPLGAELARERFGIEDEATLNAIRRHTLASPEMTTLDAVVYLADGLEPGRRFAERPEYEALAFRDLDAAMLAVLQSTVAYLERRTLPTSPVTERALRAYRGGNVPV